MLLWWGLGMAHTWLWGLICLLGLRFLAVVLTEPQFCFMAVAATLRGPRLLQSVAMVLTGAAAPVCNAGVSAELPGEKRDTQRKM